ncbi:MAG TPA: hypothetical protein VF215_06405 [Thermoanaerobaculia bacterium]
MATAAKVTTDHGKIRKWVEARGGRPSHVAASGSGDDPGILRIDYPGFSGEGTLEEIDWDPFFEAFEENKLAFLYQDTPRSRFSKFVARGSSSKKRSTKKAASTKKSSSTKKAGTTKKSTKKSSATSKKSSKKSTTTKKATAKRGTSKKIAAKSRHR